jgi:hypothetical protein
LNTALEEATKTYPNLRVITFAYFNTLPTPKTLKPHKNLWINIVSSSISQNQAGDQFNGIQGVPANRYYERAITDWCQEASGVTVYHWDGVDQGNSEYSEWPHLFPHWAVSNLKRNRGSRKMSPGNCYRRRHRWDVPMGEVLQTSPWERSPSDGKSSYTGRA